MQSEKLKVIKKIVNNLILLMVCGFLHPQTLSASLDEEKLISSNATLKEAVRESIELNYRVKQAKERVIQADFMIREALADFLPQVTLSSNTKRLQYSGFDIQDYAQTDLTAAVSYNLYSGGKSKAQMDKNKIVKKEQQEKLKGTMQEEISKVIDSYLSVVYGRLSMDVNKKNYEKLLKIYEIVKTKRALGAATAGDENSISSSVFNAKTAMTNTESAYNNAKNYYEFSINKNIEQLNPFETSFDVKLEEFDNVFEQIKSKNVDLNIIKAQIEGKKKDVYINKATAWPTVDLSVSNTRRYRDDYIQSISNIPTDGFNSDTIMLLSINYNIYTGGRVEAKTARIMSETTDNIYNLEYITKETKWDSQKLFNSVQTNTDTLETLTGEIVASEKMVDAYWERFRLSSQDLITLLLAQRQLNSAELEKLRSEKTRIIDYFNLLAKEGKLLEYFGY